MSTLPNPKNRKPSPERLARVAALQEKLNRNGHAPEDDPEHPTMRRGVEQLREADPITQAAQFVGISVGDPSRMGYWVDVDLPAYQGMRVLFRTSNQTRVRRERPTYTKTQDIIEIEVKARQLSEQLQASTEYSADLIIEHDRIMDRLLAAREKLTDEFHGRMCIWLAKYAIDFDPWPFKNIPKPDPSDPLTYSAIMDELEDLYHWLIDLERGYSKALFAATKNY